MAAFDSATLDRWRKLAIVDRDGATVGTIGEFYLDRETGHPTWALVNTGLFGATQTFVPLVDVTEIADGLQVPYTKNHIKDAPRMDPHDELTPDEEASLFAHYGVEYQPSPDPGVVGTAESGELAGGPDTVAPPGGEAAGRGGGTALGAADPEAAGRGGPVPPGAEPPGPVRNDQDPSDGPGVVPAEPGAVGPGSAAGPGDAEESRPGSSDGVPAEPGTTDPEVAGSKAPEGGPSGRSGAAAPGGPGATEPTGATRLDPDGAGPPPGQDHDEPTLAGTDPSRPVPVEPGLPGSTATAVGPDPTTVQGAGADPMARPMAGAPREPAEAGWAPGAPGSFEEPEPLAPPPSTNDRWREAKQAAERERAARAAAQHEERSPLERARRRLERLVGSGQPPTDADQAADRDAAERARRARLGFDEDER